MIEGIEICVVRVDKYYILFLFRRYIIMSELSVRKAPKENNEKIFGPVTKNLYLHAKPRGTSRRRFNLEHVCVKPNV